MNLPFTTDQFLAVFARYNQAIWPMQIVLNVLALLAIVLICRGRRPESSYVSALLSLLWAWMAIAYQFTFFTAINPAAWLFGAMFLLGALSFFWSGTVRNRLEFRLARGLRTWLGGLFIVFALVIYPVLGRLWGHLYPAVPTFGTPCPTTIFTLGVLLFAAEPIPKSVFVVPLSWAAVGSFAAFQLGVLQDLGLLASGLIVLILIAATTAR
jgi:hypothetical protein